MKINSSLLFSNEHSIVRDVNIRLLLTVTLVAILMITTNYIYSSIAAYRQLNIRADEFIHTISRTLTSSIWTLDQENIRNITRAFANNDWLAYIQVIDEHEKTLFTIGGEESNMVFREIDINFEQNRIGRLRIGLTTVPLEREISSLLWNSLSIIAIVLATLFLVIRHFLRTTLQQPLAVLFERIDQIAQGRYTQPLTPIRYREIKIIVKRFDSMADKISQREQSLNEANNRLKLEIADRKRAQETLQRYMDILEATPDFVAMVNRDGRILYLNNGGRRMVGLAENEPLHELQLADFFPKEIRKQIISEAVPAAVNKSFWSSETLLKTQGGKTLPTSQVILAHKSATGEIDYYSTIARDISLQKQAETTLKTHRDLLEKSVAERTRDLQQEIAIRQQTERELRASREKADSANRAKSQFLANMSHELRTPLNGILGYVQILQKQLSSQQIGIVHQKFHDGLHIIHQCGVHLLTLINDILDLAKVEAGRLELEQRDFSLQSLLSELNSLFRSQAEEKHLTFQVKIPAELPQYVRGDDRKLRQVLINLLGNAVKFTKAGGISLEVRRTGNDVRFAVIDTGVGFPEQKLGDIFKPFTQLHETAGSYEGTGLGLAISFNMVNLLGGRLNVVSTPGRGSEFWFCITLPESDPAIMVHDAERMITGFEGSAKRVMIVDDKPVNRAVLVGLLDPLGFVCIEAIDGQDCLDKIHKFRPDSILPDLILMDLVMPKLDGLQTTRQLRRMPELSEVVIIALSASAFNVHKEQCLMAGCDEFLPKPIEAAQLFETMARLLNLRWQYAATEEKRDANPAAETAVVKLDHLPDSNAKALWEATRAGHAKGVLQQAAELEALGEPYAEFAKQLRTLIKQFKFKQIMTLLEPFVGK